MYRYFNIYIYAHIYSYLYIYTIDPLSQLIPTDFFPLSSVPNAACRPKPDKPAETPWLPTQRMLTMILPIQAVQAVMRMARILMCPLLGKISKWNPKWKLARPHQRIMV